MEDDFDFLYVYDGKGNEIARYTGTEAAGKTLTVPGETVTIVIEADESSSEWGFVVSEMTVNTMAHAYTETIVVAPTCTKGGYTTFICKACQYSLPLNWTNKNGRSPTCSS